MQMPWIWTECGPGFTKFSCNGLYAAMYLSGVTICQTCGSSSSSSRTSNRSTILLQHGRLCSAIAVQQPVQSSKLARLRSHRERS